jgi:hypothetical protein
MSHIQIAKDCYSLAQLLHYLGYTCGPIKASSITGIWVTVWFAETAKTSNIKRVTALVTNGFSSLPRRVYRDIVITSFLDEVHTVDNDEFDTAGLMPPYEYAGTSWMDIKYEENFGIYPENPERYPSRIPFYAYLDEDVQRAKKMCASLIEQYSNEGGGPLNPDEEARRQDQEDRDSDYELRVKREMDYRDRLADLPRDDEGL